MRDSHFPLLGLMGASSPDESSDSSGSILFTSVPLAFVALFSAALAIQYVIYGRPCCEDRRRRNARDDAETRGASRDGARLAEVSTLPVSAMPRIQVRVSSASDGPEHIADTYDRSYCVSGPVADRERDPIAPVRRQSLMMPRVVGSVENEAYEDVIAVSVPRDPAPLEGYENVMISNLKTPASREPSRNSQYSSYSEDAQLLAPPRHQHLVRQALSKQASAAAPAPPEAAAVATLETIESVGSGSESLSLVDDSAYATVEALMEVIEKHSNAYENLGIHLKPTPKPRTAPRPSNLLSATVSNASRMSQVSRIYADDYYDNSELMSAAGSHAVASSHLGEEETDGVDDGDSDDNFNRKDGMAAAVAFTVVAESSKTSEQGDGTTVATSSKQHGSKVSGVVTPSAIPIKRRSVVPLVASNATGNMPDGMYDDVVLTRAMDLSPGSNNGGEDMEDTVGGYSAIGRAVSGDSSPPMPATVPAASTASDFRHHGYEEVKLPTKKQRKAKKVNKVALVAPSSAYEHLSVRQYREIPSEQVERTRIVGRGAFGEVWTGNWKQANADTLPVAIKRLHDKPDGLARRKLLDEADLLGRFHHRNIVRLYGVTESKSDGQKPQLVLEWVEHGSLLGWLRGVMPGDLLSHAELAEKLISFGQQIACGLEYLQKEKFIHRDLAARNILLSDDFTCKICDFGMSKILAEEMYYSRHGGKLPVKWSAPEVILKQKFSLASDVWSFGVVLYEIWSLGRKPYFPWSAVKVAEEVCAGHRLLAPPGCPLQLYTHMIACWHSDTSKRPSVSDLVKEFNTMTITSLRSQDTTDEYEVINQLGRSHGDVALPKGFDVLQRRYKKPPVAPKLSTRR